MNKILRNTSKLTLIFFAITAIFLVLPSEALAFDPFFDNLEETQPQNPCGEDGDGNAIQQEINLSCQRARILDPQGEHAQNCDLLICPGTAIAQGETIDVTFFNVNFRLNSEQAVGQVLFIIFSVVLGLVVMAMVVLGIYGSYLRAQADSPDDIAASQKVITNAIIGFLIVGLSLLIIQVFASLIGLGSINELVDFGPALQNT